MTCTSIELRSQNLNQQTKSCRTESETEWPGINLEIRHYSRVCVISVRHRTGATEFLFNYYFQLSDSLEDPGCISHQSVKTTTRSFWILSPRRTLSESLISRSFLIFLKPLSLPPFLWRLLNMSLSILRRLELQTANKYWSTNTNTKPFILRLTSSTELGIELMIYIVGLWYSMTLCCWSGERILIIISNNVGW